MPTAITATSPVLGTTILPATTTTAVPLSTSTTTADALLKLCLLWSVLNKPELQRFGDDPDFPEVPSPPLICNDYFLYNNNGRAPYYSYSGNGYGGNRNFSDIDGNENEIRGNHSTRRVIHRMEHKYSSRSFAVIGALAGIVFILLIMALTTCIRHRRELYLTDDPASRERSYARDVLLNHIRQFRATNSAERRIASLDPPPSYDDVVKVTLEQQQQSSSEPSASSEPSSSSSQRSSSDVTERSVIVSQVEDSTSQPPSYSEAVASMTPSEESPPYDEEPAVIISCSNWNVLNNSTQSAGVTTIRIE